MVVKSFFMAILFLMVIKGVGYILWPQFTKKMASILMETPPANLVVYGWILVVMAFIVWVSYVRYLTY